MENKEIWERLRDLREEKKLTYKGLSEELTNKYGNDSFSESTLKAYESISETNRRDLTKRAIILLSDYYKISPLYLLDKSYTNKTDKNISINKELGFSDKTISKIQKIKNNKSLISSYYSLDFNIWNSINGFNKWLEDNSCFEELCKYLTTYYAIRYGMDLVFYFICLDHIEEYLIKNEYKDTKTIIKVLIEKYNILDSILNYCEIRIEEYSEIMNSILSLDNYLEKKSSSKLIKDNIFKIVTIGFMVFEELKRFNKYNKYELSETFSKSIPIEHTEIESVYYDTDIPKEYQDIINKK